MTEKSLTELDQLHNSVVEYGTFALSLLEKSIDALQTGDVVLAEEVSEKKEELKAKFVPLEDAYFQYLALYHPVARDMRECVASIRIIYNLERIGRMGFDIGDTIIRLSESTELHESSVLVRMGRFVIRMISDAIHAYEHRTTLKITDMSGRDKEIDKLYCDVLTEFISRMQSEKEAVPILTRYVIINRYLERCGDQACNMAEMILYMITGERIEVS